jgi:AcrR family transcriptional regulator
MRSTVLTELVARGLRTVKSPAAIDVVAGEEGWGSMVSRDRRAEANPAAARPGSTAEQILRCATHRFWRDGYALTSVRGIAQEVGVDPALVIRYFGSKEELFLKALPAHEFWEEVLTGPLDTLGPRLVEFVLSRASDRMLALHTTLIRASDRPAVRARLYEIVDETFIDNLKDRLPGPDPALRARLIAVQVGGLLQSLSISDWAPRGDDHAAVIAIYGRAIQATVSRGNKEDFEPR